MSVQMITCPAVITKAQIEPVGKQHGTRNSTRVSLWLGGEDHEFGPGEVVFLVFAGKVDLTDGLYHGEYRFRTATSYDAKMSMSDFGKLPGFGNTEVEDGN